MNTSSKSMMRLLAVTIITTTTSLLLIKVDTSGDSKSSSLESDKQALLIFYNALPSVGTRLDWLLNNDICKWKGVTCKKEPKGTSARVVELALGGLGLYGAIVQNSIGKLNKLERLVLRGNSLYGTLPTDILSIHTLEYIHLANNKFCGDLPKFSGTPPNLMGIDLSLNKFTGEIPTVFGKAKELIYLNLSFNLFSGKIPPDFKLENLGTLDLSNNTLQGEIPPSLKKFYEQNSFVGNEDLCGNPLPTPCPPTASAPLSNAAYSNKLPHHVALMASSLLLFLLLL